MQRLPTLVFDDVNSGDLNKIFLNANVQIKDSDGAGTPMYITVIDLSNLGGSIATIADLLAAPAQWVTIGGTPHGYIAETTQATYTPDADGLDFFEYTLDQDATIENIINGNIGDTGTIQINQAETIDGFVTTWGNLYKFTNGVPVMNTDKTWIHIFEYKIISNTSIHMEFLSSYSKTIVFSMLVTSPTAPGFNFTRADNIYVDDNLDGTYDVYSYEVIESLTFTVNKTDVTLFDIIRAGYLTQLSCEGMTGLMSVVFNNDTSTITDFSNVFKDCSALECLNTIDTTGAINKTDMFTNCPALVQPDATAVTDLMDTDGANWTNIEVCPILKGTRIRYWTTMTDAAAEASVMGIFGGLEISPEWTDNGDGSWDLWTDKLCTFLGANLDVPATKIEIINGSSLTELYYEQAVTWNLWILFADNPDCTDILLGDMDLSALVDHDMGSMFSGCGSLTNIVGLDTSSAISMSSMFSGCESLTNIVGFDASSAEVLNGTFADCTNLTSIDLVNTSNVIEAEETFVMCTNLTSVIGLDASNIERTGIMFAGCENLTSINLVNTSNVVGMFAMFADCSSLVCIDAIDTITAVGIDGVTDMFTGCTALVQPDAAAQTDLTDGDGAAWINANPCP